MPNFKFLTPPSVQLQDVTDATDISISLAAAANKQKKNQRRCRTPANPRQWGVVGPPPNVFPPVKLTIILTKKAKHGFFLSGFSCKISHAQCCVQSTTTINNRVLYCFSVLPHVKFGEDPTKGFQVRVFTS